MDLRVVDIMVVDVILDMDELIAIGLSVIGTLTGFLIPDTVLELCEVMYARGWMRRCMEFRDEILLRRGECETPRKSNL